ncbi:MAG: hypothetical protein HQK66_11035 [Desulfamplus sp.]|nr:hypothetical protein [Desulfamplus sp.]
MIRKLIAEIPDTSDEACLAIQSVIFAGNDKAVLDCHLSEKFDIVVHASRIDKVALTSPAMQETIFTDVSGWIPELKKLIYQTDTYLGQKHRLD